MNRPTITLTAFTWVFVPFALLLSAGLVAAEASEALDHQRMIYAIWVSLVLAIPALGLFVFPRHRDGVYELLLWTAAYAAYAVHFIYSFGLVYHFSIAELYRGQAPLIATTNLALTALWTLDVGLAWWGPRQAPWLRAERVTTRALFLVEAIASSVVIFDGFVRAIGWGLIAAIALAVAVRWRERRRAPAPQEIPAPQGARW